MNSENSSQNKNVSVSHNEQLRHLFKSLKALAFGMFFAGIVLLFIVNYMKLSPGAEFAVLLFFGVAGGLYLIGRGRSILLQYHEINAKIELSKKAQELSSKNKQTQDQTVSESVAKQSEDNL